MESPRPADPATESSRPGVSLVLCAYTELRWHVLELALAEAVRQIHADDEVILVTDYNDSLFELATRELPGVTVIPNAQKRGISGARNTGVEHARGDIIVFLDDDAVPRAQWLAATLEPFSDPEVIGTGGRAYPKWHGQAPRWLPEEFLWVVGCSHRGLPERIAEIRNPLGATMAFRRDVILSAGGFTDGIGRIGRTPLGCEETEFAIRARKVTGGRIVLQPSAIVDHYVTSERASRRYFHERCWAEGISKAAVSAAVGTEAALATERSYVARTLPLGVWRGLKDWVAGDRHGLSRASAIVSGLLITAAGYVRGRTHSMAVREPSGSWRSLMNLR